MSTTSPRQTARLPQRIAIAGPVSIVIGAAFAIGADAAIAAAAHAAGVPAGFSPLHQFSYIALTIAGVLAAGVAAVSVIAVTVFAILMPVRRRP